LKSTTPLSARWTCPTNKPDLSGAVRKRRMGTAKFFTLLLLLYLTQTKSQAVASDADEIVITADTMVFLDDKKLGKPADEAEALQMLTALQGRRHTVCTGVTVRQGEKALTRAQHTDVYFRPATQRELKAYIAGGEPMDKAGAYGVQGQGALLVERIDGDFFNVMGLPVVLLAEMLGEFGIQLLG
jgi:septum formation protein